MVGVLIFPPKPRPSRGAPVSPRFAQSPILQGFPAHRIPRASRGRAQRSLQNGSAHSRASRKASWHKGFQRIG